MRFEQLIKGNLCRAGVATAALCLFASGLPVSAFGQTTTTPAAQAPAAPSSQAPAAPASQTPTATPAQGTTAPPAQAPAAPSSQAPAVPTQAPAPAGQTTPPAGDSFMKLGQKIEPGETRFELSADEAVRMALENNLGIRAERLSPQVQALILNQTRANYAPNLISTLVKNSSTTPPENFLTGSGSALTNAGVRTNGGLEQLLKWGGGSYQRHDRRRAQHYEQRRQRFQSAPLVQSQRDLHPAAPAQLLDRSTFASSCSPARKSRRSSICNCSSG